jgi:hypothetical protein
MRKKKIVKDVVKDEPVKMAKPKMLFSMVFQVPFEPDWDLYDTTSLEEMAAIDEKEALKDPELAFKVMSQLPGVRWRVKVSGAGDVAKKTGLKVKE